MSGLELLGALAAASQAAGYSIKVISSLREIYRLVNGRTNQYQQQSDQVEQLISTIELIQGTKLLEMPQSEVHLRAILERTEELHKVLREILYDSSRNPRKIYWKALLSGNREDKIRKSFADLEEQKSTFILHVIGAYGKLLLEIRDGLGEGLPQIQNSVHRIEAAFENYPDILSKMQEMQGQMIAVGGLPADLPYSHGTISDNLVGRTPLGTDPETNSVGSHLCKKFHLEDEEAGFDSDAFLREDLVNRSKYLRQGPIQSHSAGNSNTNDGPPPHIPRERVENSDVYQYLDRGSGPHSAPITDPTLVNSVSDICLQRPASRQDSEQSSESVTVSGTRVLHTYSNIYATADARQLNGNIGRDDNNNGTSRHYERIVAGARCRQINGDIFDPAIAMALFLN